MSGMLVIWEGRVPSERQQEFVRAHDEATATPPRQLQLHFLTQDAEDPTLMRIVSVWESDSAFQEYG
jgi:heme-degrading monooxygenase HmoA